MQSDTITVRVNGPLGTVVINRPDQANALSLDMIEGLNQAIGDLYLEKRVRAVVITGSGSVFCGGRDLVEMHGSHEQTTHDDIGNAAAQWGDEAEQFRDLIATLLEFPKPLIAAANGPVVGMGAALLLSADIVLACDTATLRLPEPQRGLVAGVVAPLVAYRAGASAAARLLFSPTGIAATEAHRLGLYHELVAHDLLWARSAQLAEELAACAPEALGLTKRLLLETYGERLLTDLTSGAVASATARTTPAAQEGVRAFVEKRPPKWG